MPQHPKLSKDQFLSAYQKGIKIIDTRNKIDFAKGFIPHSINIQNNNSFSTWMGWFLNYEEQFILIADEAQMNDLTRKLMRIGLDNMYGFISNIHELELVLNTADVINLDEFKTYLNKEDVQIVDVRGLTEYNAGHVAHAHHVFVGTLHENLNKVDKEKQVVIHCQAGDRSSIAYSILRKNGFNNVKNYSGGMKEWKEKKNPIVTTSTAVCC